jgi:GH15 family glucan-1,4-alpha-glucosidase
MDPLGTGATRGLHGSPFPPIAEYGFLSDCETTALVAPSGNIEWLCLPRIDSPSVFGSILDRDAGGFRFGPADVSVPAARRYLPGTNILETSWSTSTGWIIVRDLLLIGPWLHEEERSSSHRRPPTDYDAQHILLRMVRCVNGEVQLSLNCEPVFDYGREFGTWEYSGRGYRQAVCRPPTGDLALTLTSDINLGFEAQRAIGRTLVKEGDVRFCALGWGRRTPPLDADDAYKRLVWTAHHWQHWLARGRFPDHPWRHYLERSALTLKGLTYEPSGSVVAAATTSLPETPHGERNYDYRYSWIRDSTFALWGLYTLGFDWEANDYLYFIADAAERTEDELHVMYSVDGEPVREEQVLTHLSGYEGARPVRIGNAAYRQRQHDVWGAVLDSVYLHTKSRDQVDERIWPILKRQVEAALRHWREPDRGMWEVRGEPKHFTSSKLMCWVALERGARLAELREDRELAQQWRAAAAEIHADICANGVDRRGVFTQHYGTEALDASLLLMPLLRFLPPTDERIQRTVLAIADELTEGGLVLRYRTEETDDGFAGKEGTFTICSFWLVSALVEIGELTRARRLCEKLLSYASPLGLYGEEIDAETGRHLGNFPQAFTHLALINAVIHLIDAEERGAAGPAPLSPPAERTRVEVRDTGTAAVASSRAGSGDGQPDREGGPLAPTVAGGPEPAAVTGDDLARDVEPEPEPRHVLGVGPAPEGLEDRRHVVEPDSAVDDLDDRTVVRAPDRDGDWGPVG